MSQTDSETCPNFIMKGIFPLLHTLQLWCRALITVRRSFDLLLSIYRSLAAQTLSFKILHPCAGVAPHLANAVLGPEPFKPPVILSSKRTQLNRRVELTSRIHSSIVLYHSSQHSSSHFDYYHETPGTSSTKSTISPPKVVRSIILKWFSSRWGRTQETAHARPTVASLVSNTHAQ